MLERWLCSERLWVASETEWPLSSRLHLNMRYRPIRILAITWMQESAYKKIQWFHLPIIRHQFNHKLYSTLPHTKSYYGDCIPSTSYYNHAPPSPNHLHFTMYHFTMLHYISLVLSACHYLAIYSVIHFTMHALSSSCDVGLPPRSSYHYFGNTGGDVS